MRCSPNPPPRAVPVWDTFRPETHRHLVVAWTDLLQRRLPAVRGRVPEPEGTRHERHLAQGRAGSFAPAGHRLCPAVDAAAGAEQSGEHPTGSISWPSGRARWAGPRPRSK